MPKESQRQYLLRHVTTTLSKAILDEEMESSDSDCGSAGSRSDNESDSESDSDEEMTPVDEMFELLALIESARYLNPPEKIPKAPQFRVNTFMELPDETFRQAARMSKATFLFVVHEIEDHPIFQNDSYCKQAPVWQQLAVAVDRLGNYGNDASRGRTMHHWGIGKGTCDLYLARVLLALKSIAPKYIRWSSEQERAKMSKRMAGEGFPGCVGFLDGTTIPLSQKPGEDDSCFFDRRHRYSINAQVICDDKRRILHSRVAGRAPVATAPCTRRWILPRRSGSVHISPLISIYLQIPRTQPTTRTTQSSRPIDRRAIELTMMRSTKCWHTLAW
jgi:hypothetical protein